jgi:exodeoxyribonuclease V beta subunit
VTFSLTGPLPTGTTVIEASAGTGKTYAIIGLATRYIAEGMADLSELMLVTFGRAATQELRERARARIAATAHALTDPGAARSSSDALVAHLADAADAEVALRRRRLLRAMSDFDAATIATTHSFCQQMLNGLGILGENEPDSMLVESVEDLLAEVGDDLYVGLYAAQPDPALTLDEARSVAREAVADPQARLVPDNAGPATAPGGRVAFAAAARAELARRKRMAGVRDFDDLLVLLRDTLAHPVHGAMACARIQQRYRVVLVDEFQDTDSVQWEILRRAFHGTVTLVLVGDPKQAIYAFRGADVMTYLDAVAVAGSPAELDVNRRSDAALLTALEHVYGGAALGHEEIVAHPVTAFHQDHRIPGGPPLRLRYLNRTGSGELGASGFPAVDAVKRRIAADVAGDVVATLTSGATFTDAGQQRPVLPSDIAVLVRSRDQVDLVRDAFRKVGIPSVLAGGASVFQTDAAIFWQRVLAAMAQPHRPDRVRLAALTPLFGYTVTRLDEGGDTLVADISTALREHAATFGAAGLAAVYEQLAAAARLDEQLLAIEGGERALTDLRHLAQLLNRAATVERLGLTALSRWLTNRIGDDQFASSADRSRLLDRDHAAVRIVTIHASKGLEFPIVYLPFSWDGWKPSSPASLLLHENGQRIRDVGGPAGPGYTNRKTQHRREEAGEDLRLLYVALTRAMCRVIAWWAPTYSTGSAPLHRLLLGRTPGQLHPHPKPAIPADATLASVFGTWASPAAGLISVEAVPRPDNSPPAQWTPTTGPARALDVATFNRQLDTLWRRTSYTGLTAADHASPGVTSETDEITTTDEPEVPPTSPGSAAPPEPGTRSLMNALPAGAAFGTLVHAVLESIDTDAVDLATEVRRCCRETGATRLTSLDIETLADALTAVMTTPLGRGTLADVAAADRLAELDFELPLAGGDAPTGSPATLSLIAGLLREHLPDDDLLAAYPDMLDTVQALPLRGFLTGSIDAVLRYPGPEFVIVDYKTNKIFSGPVDASQLDQETMAHEMMRSHYPLQALLYSVALHRYLRWRLPAYSPDANLGGVQYLFVRAMIGAGTPRGCGVFTWRPSAELVVKLSDLLAGL